MNHTATQADVDVIAKIVKELGRHRSPSQPLEKR
jgi:hypothetical protein